MADNNLKEYEKQIVLAFGIDSDYRTGKRCLVQDGRVFVIEPREDQIDLDAVTEIANSSLQIQTLANRIMSPLEKEILKTISEKGKISDGSMINGKHVYLYDIDLEDGTASWCYETF
jgi:hypothetical protein